VYTIAPSSALPDIIDSVTIDGYSQPPFVTPSTGPFVHIELSGVNAGSGVDGLVFKVANSTVTGLAINGWSRRGIVIKGSGATNNKVQGNYIGTDTSGGVLAEGNSSDGVLMQNAPKNTIAGNTISHNGGNGVSIVNKGATGNKVQGNYIGTNYAGTAGESEDGQGNSSNGVYISDAPNNTVGGTTAGTRNIISGNGRNGVYVVNNGATGNKVQGNYIGTDLSGTQDLGNGIDGVQLLDPPSNTTIGGTVAAARNVISGNDRNGVTIDGGSFSNKVQGNYIGTDLSGTQDLGNSADGVRIQRNAATNTIGGPVMNQNNPRNVISGNDQTGVVITGAKSNSNKVQGNYIGTDNNGTADLGNTFDGVQITDGSSTNTIGGTVAGLRNVISANDGNGLAIFGFTNTGSASKSNKVLGNYIGTDTNGTADLGNTYDGVTIVNVASNNLIGGTAPGARNVMSGNNGKGVSIYNTGAKGNKVQSNYIGTDNNGTNALGNSSDGVLIQDAPNNTIGVPSNVLGTGNVISGNSGSGIVVLSAGATGNRILSNSIHANNGGLGIDLDLNNVTANDFKDLDTGPNNRQNYPVLTSAPTGSQTKIHGSLNSNPGRPFTIQFFSSPQKDPSGNGEGKEFLGQKSVVTTNPSGNVSFTFTASSVVPLGQVVSATATDDTTLDTSEFSAAIFTCGGSQSTC
jgi:titin